MHEAFAGKGRIGPDSGRRVLCRNRRPAPRPAPTVPLPAPPGHGRRGGAVLPAPRHAHHGGLRHRRRLGRDRAPCRRRRGALLPAVPPGGRGGRGGCAGSGHHPAAPLGLQRLRRSVVFALRRRGCALPAGSPSPRWHWPPPRCPCCTSCLGGPAGRPCPNGGPAHPENFQLIFGIAAGISITLSNVIATGIGISVRQRREHEQEIAAWAARTAQLGSVTERNRIAREMHDVVAHSLTVMVSLSDGAAVVVRKSPDRAAGCWANCPAPDGPPWRTCGACWESCGTTRRPARRRASPWRRQQPGQAARRIPHRGPAAALHAHRPSLPDDAAFQLTVTGSSRNR